MEKSETSRCDQREAVSLSPRRKAYLARVREDPSSSTGWKGRSWMRIGLSYQKKFRRPFDPYREEFLQRSGLLPPPFLRVIDCRRSVNEWAVVLIDWDVKAPGEREGGYTAISHTYGMEVYKVFDCGCATMCLGKPRADPAKMPCKQHHHDEDPHAQGRVITDILKMCELLLKAGVLYAWHDGVSIAQHDPEEVSLFIRHMGWIYANAKETVIFLHYIGLPMAPIAPGLDKRGLTSRWETRVWTFQEAVLSKRRRYCVCMGDVLEYCRNPIKSSHVYYEYCRNPLQFEQMLALWYDGGDSNSAIIEECEFSNLILLLTMRLNSARQGNGMQLNPHAAEWMPDADAGEWLRGGEWERCLCSWKELMNDCLVSFPSIAHALHSCSRRESKHEGDRINSILGLAGVQNFDAHKDDNIEESTMKLFKKMGNNGLALALFTTNESSPPSKAITSIHQHTWLPSLSGPLVMHPSHFQEREPNFHTDNMQFVVLEDGNIELKGLLAYVDVQFNVVSYEKERAGSSSHSDTLKEQASPPSAEGGRLNVDISGHLEASVYQVSLSGVNLGLMFIPVLDLDSIHHIFQQGLMHHATMSQFLEKHHIFHLIHNETMHQFSEEKRIKLTALGFSEQCTSWKVDIQNILNKRRMPTGSERMISFCASLIFPAKVLELNIESNFPAIVVQGNINSQVTKIGCFWGTEVLYGILQRQHAPTTINNLVVR